MLFRVVGKIVESYDDRGNVIPRGRAECILQYCIIIWRRRFRGGDEDVSNPRMIKGVGGRG